MILLTGFYVERNPARRRELLQCLRANAALDEIEEIHLLIEEPIAPAAAAALADELRHPKVRLAVHGRRASFADFFAYANTRLAGRPTALANADIHFDATLARLHWLDLAGRMLCLSRWDLQADGSARFFEQPASQDAWIFLPPVALRDCDFHLGRLGCDQRVSWQALQAGLAVSNPSRTLHALHLHLSGVRRYSEAERLGGAYHSIAATYLETPWVWFVVTSRNRLADLRQSLPRLVAQARSSTVMIDYGCAQGSGAWTAAAHPRVRASHVPDNGLFHGAAARQAGAARADEDGLLCFVDADCQVEPGFSDLLLSLHTPGSYCVPDRAGPGWDNLLAVSRRDFDAVGGMDTALRGGGLEMAELRARLAAAGLARRDFDAGWVRHAPQDRADGAQESPPLRATRRAIHRACMRVSAAIAAEAPASALDAGTRADIYRTIAAHHWARDAAAGATAVAFSDAMGMCVQRLVPGVSSHVNVDRPFESLHDTLCGRQFTQVVASRVSPVRLRFVTPGKLLVLVGTDWEGQWPARAWLRDHGHREALPAVTTRAGTAFEVWSLGGDTGDEHVLPTQVMLVADELVPL